MRLESTVLEFITQNIWFRNYHFRVSLLKKRVLWSCEVALYDSRKDLLTLISADIDCLWCRDNIIVRSLKRNICIIPLLECNAKRWQQQLCKFYYLSELLYVYWCLIWNQFNGYLYRQYMIFKKKFYPEFFLINANWKETPTFIFVWI